MRKTSLKAAILWAALALAAALAVACDSATSSKPNVSGNDDDKKDETPEQVVTNDSSKGIMGIEAADRIFGTDGWSGDGGSVTIKGVKSFAEMEAWIKDSTVTQRAVTLNRAPGSGALFAAGGLGLQFYAAKIDGKDITKIEAKAFSADAEGKTLGGTNIAAVRLPETIRDVAADAFSGSGISVVIIPAAVLADAALADMVSDLADALKKDEITPGTPGTDTEEVYPDWRVYTKIDSIEELAKIADPTDEDYPMDGYYRLTADLDFGNYKEDWVPIGSAAHPFTGIFDGNGKTITNFILPQTETEPNIVTFDMINASNLQFIGLFGYTAAAKLSNTNLHLAEYYNQPGSELEAGADRCFVGAMAAYVNGTVLSNIHVTGAPIMVSSAQSNVYIGGLVGSYSFGTRITGCSSDVDVQGWNNAEDASPTFYIGGMAGGVCFYDITGVGSIINVYKDMFFMSIMDSVSSGKMSLLKPDGEAVKLSRAYIGGLAGVVQDVSGSRATGKIEINNEGSATIYAGGIAGHSYGTIDDSSAEGAVSVTTSGTLYAGGLAGMAAKITGSGAKSGLSVNGTAASYIGGLAGRLSTEGTNNRLLSGVSDSYAEGDVEASITGEGYAACIGGLIGSAQIAHFPEHITDCYAKGNVTVSTTGVATGSLYPGSLYVGGIIGSLKNGRIENCRADGSLDIDSDRPAFVGGIAGELACDFNYNPREMHIHYSLAANPSISVIAAEGSIVNRVLGKADETDLGASYGHANAVLSHNGANAAMTVRYGTSDGDIDDVTPEEKGACTVWGEDVIL